MGLLSDAERDIERRADAADAEGETPTVMGAATAEAASARAGSVEVDGEVVDLEEVDTQQPDEDGTWLTGTDSYGRPRGVDAMENRQIVQTSAMQSIVNGIAGQLLGGDLAFEPDDDVLEDLSDSEADAAADLRALLRDILEGPHVGGYSLDDLVTAAIEDMIGPGQAYWRVIGTESNDLPVATLQTLDPLTIRRNVDRHGIPGDPPYWQAHGAFSGGSMTTMGALEPVPLERSDLVEFSYPYGNRSYRAYPVSPAWQVREWLEILANSTTHHNRFYADDEIPPGLLQVVNASDTTVKDIKEKIEAASGDPRTAPVVGGEGGAQWVEMGGTAINLNVIEEQRWFYFLCLGSLGMGKAEVGMIEDVNRSNGEVESTRVYKRVGGPFTEQFKAGFRQMALQFDAYSDLGQPWVPTIDYTDPRETRAKAERVRKEYQAGTATYNQAQRANGNDPDTIDTTVTVDGETIDFGDKPQWVVERLFAAADAGEPSSPENPDASEDGEV